MDDDKLFKPAASLITPENFFGANHKDFLNILSNKKNLAPAGRLDIDSSGLLILTQDGRIAKAIIGNKSKVEKEYLVRVEGKLTERSLNLLRYGLSLDGYQLKPAIVNWINNDQLNFTLVEGRNRQIRRMCELVGLKVTGLKRVRIGPVVLADLQEGQWKFLTKSSFF